MNLTDLKKVIATSVMDPLDHKNIDLDVPYFAENAIVSTTENVAVFIFNNIRDQLLADQHRAKLYEVKTVSYTHLTLPTTPYV